MKKYIFILFTLHIVSVCNATAQEIDKADIRCLYQYIFVGDLNQPEKKANDEMLLLVGSGYSTFYSYKNFMADSLRKVNPAEYAPSIVEVDGVKTAVPAKTRTTRSFFSSDIYITNRMSGQVICMEKIGLSYYSYEETPKEPTWDIKTDTCLILSYVCQKATTTYCGRDWTVWFAQAIPISEGPWKLRGLPGLILKAVTADGEFDFTAQGLERSNSKYPIAKDNEHSYRLLSKKDFFQTKKTFWEKPFANEGVKSMTSGGRAVSIQFNFIEKP